MIFFKDDLIHELMQIRAFIELSLNLVLLLFIMSEAYENNLSTGTDVATVEKMSRAILAKQRYIFS